jgi:hypothetical protein
LFSIFNSQRVHETPLKFSFIAQSPSLCFDALDFIHLSRLGKNVLQNITIPKNKETQNSQSSIDLKFGLDISDFNINVFVNGTKLHLYFQNIFSLNVLNGADIIKPQVIFGKDKIIEIEKLQLTHSLQKDPLSSSFESFNDSYNPKNYKKEEILKKNIVLTLLVQSPNIVFSHDTEMGDNSDKFTLGIKGVQKILQDDWKGAPFIGNFAESPALELPTIKLVLNDVKLDFDDNPIEKSLAIHMQIWPKEAVS